jgi:hypothetical protein
MIAVNIPFGALTTIEAKIFFLWSEASPQNANNTTPLLQNAFSGSCMKYATYSERHSKNAISFSTVCFATCT